MFSSSVSARRTAWTSGCKAGSACRSTVSRSGDRYCILGSLFDGDLGEIGFFDYLYQIWLLNPLQSDDHVKGGSSPDGSLGYFGSLVSGGATVYTTAVLKVGLSGNRPLERFEVPGLVFPWLVLPAGDRLIALGAGICYWQSLCGWNELLVVDLQ